MFKNYLEYIRDNPNGYWFKRKSFGWGWTPVKWQGWAVIVAYIIPIILLGLTLDENSTPQEVGLIFVLPFIILTALLIRICYKKGESPKWQWGWKK